MKIAIIYDTIFGSTFEICKKIQKELTAVFAEVEIIRCNKPIEIKDDINYLLLVSPIYGALPLFTLIEFINHHRKYWSNILGVILVVAFKNRDEEYFYNLFRSTGFYPIIKTSISGVINIPKIQGAMHTYIVEKFKELNIPVKQKIYGPTDVDEQIKKVTGEIVDYIEKIDTYKKITFQDFKKGLEKYFNARFNKEAAYNREIEVEFVVNDFNFQYHILIKNGELIFSELSRKRPDIIFRAPLIAFNQMGMEQMDGTALKEMGLLKIEGDENLLYDLFLIFSIT